MYAIIWLVMKGNKYIPGVLISAESIRKKLKNLKLDLICMVTNDVTEHKILNEVCDKVIKINYYERKVPEMKSDNQNKIYSSWMNVAATKWKCLDFTEYKKVLFIDADMVFQGTENDLIKLFKYKTPAGNFYRRSNEPFISYGIKHYFYKKKPESKTANADGKILLSGGERIPKKLLLKVIKKGLSVVNGTLVLLNPKQNKINFSEFYKDIKIPISDSGTDENLITLYYILNGFDWYQIPQNYMWIDWGKKVDFSKGLNDTKIIFLNFFGTQKPWEFKTPEYSDLKIWFDIKDELIKKNNKIKNYFKKIEN